MAKASKTQHKADLSQSSVPRNTKQKEIGMQTTSFCNVDYSKYKSNEVVLDKIKINQQRKESHEKALLSPGAIYDKATENSTDLEMKEEQQKEFEETYILW